MTLSMQVLDAAQKDIENYFAENPTGLSDLKFDTETGQDGTQYMRFHYVGIDHSLQSVNLINYIRLTYYTDRHTVYAGVLVSILEELANRLKVQYKLTSCIGNGLRMDRPLAALLDRSSIKASELIARLTAAHYKRPRCLHYTWSIAEYGKREIVAEYPHITGLEIKVKKGVISSYFRLNDRVKWSGGMLSVKILVPEMMLDQIVPGTAVTDLIDHPYLVGMTIKSVRQKTSKTPVLTIYVANQEYLKAD